MQRKQENNGRGKKTELKNFEHLISSIQQTQISLHLKLFFNVQRLQILFEQEKYKILQQLKLQINCSVRAYELMNKRHNHIKTNSDYFS